ncbi:PREDICTED: uncharacterized protein LOC109235841 [Nicotiana attenuata]|uniref:uncharacterized protein LOC109235841 n=1 Tax=Nicotiana attenuata TaxID=49451 RepID=UPI0009058E1A|nr:PREDICTED: uncharacterized protein LOC109235841 [Nicotiana attenuata]
MTNPQENPGTPPPVSPNTSSSTPPSEPPKPRFRRQKMLARKTVASGLLRKVLNEKLQASQRKEVTTKESDSSSESEKFISASEGEEPGSSDTDKSQETPGEINTCLLFSDALEREDNRFVLVGSVKNIEGAESSKMRKKKKGKVLAICGSGEEGGMKSGGSGSGEAAEGLINLSEQPDEPGSSVEETLADMLKKVEASYDPKKCKASSQRIPVASKPTKKSKVSSAKSAAPREVPTVKSKRTRSSAKKPFKSVPVESSLAKRTRSAAKGKQVQVEEEEDEEWSEEDGEEESEQEQDRFVNFGKRKILKGRLLKDLEEPGMVRLLTSLEAQGWKDMVLQMDGRLARKELVEFMANGTVKNGLVISIVKGVKCLVEGKQINWPAFIVKLLDRVLNGSNAHAIPYGFILTAVLDKLNVPLKKWKMASSKEHFGIKTLQEVGTKDAEIARLQARVVELEEDRNGLRAELAKEKEKCEGMLQTMLNLLQTQSSSSSKP